jgi:hypothetical protein
MKLEMTNFQAVAANLSVEGEVCDLSDAKLWMQAKTDAEMAPLVQKLGASSIAEIERLIVELQEAKGHLQSEQERIEREAIRYRTLTQMVSTTAKIISDAVSQWHPACDEQKSNACEASAASSQDLGIRMSAHHGPGDEETDATYGEGASHCGDPEKFPGETSKQSPCDTRVPFAGDMQRNIITRA